MHPTISSQLASERRREMLASAQQQRLARQIRASRRESRRTGRAGQPMRRILRTKPRLSTEETAMHHNHPTPVMNARVADPHRV
jgi:hypothetical protein